MVTTVTNTKQQVSTQKKGIGFAGAGGLHGGGARGPNGNNGNGGGGGGGRRDGTGRDWTPDRYRIGMWVALASILMMFTALTSAYIVRAGLSDDWQPIAMPPFILLSTGLIIAGSITFEVARMFLKRGREEAYKIFLSVTLLLGFGFLVAQLLAWRQLVAQGIYLVTNPHSSFFYLLTGLHGVHILGGLLALTYLLLRAWRKRRWGEHDAEAKRSTATDVVAIYWHFMDGLWIYLFGLLFLWR